MLDLQKNLSRLIRLRRELIAKLTPDHEPDNIVHLKLGSRSCRNVAAVAHNGDLIGDTLDLRHLMRNVDDTHAALAQHMDDLKQVLDLLLGQRGRRLVKYNDLGMIRNGLGDLHHLPLRNRHRAHNALWINVDAELLKNGGGVTVHLRLVNDKARNLRIASKPEIVHDRPLEAPG